MPQSHPSRLKLGLAALVGLALAGSPVLSAPAFAAPDNSGVVINEAYLNGGSSGASYLNKFVELYNPTDSAVDLSTMSLQYRAAASTGNPTGVLPLSGSIAAKGHYLIGGTSNAANGEPLPTADASLTFSFAGGGGTLILAKQTTPLTAPAAGSIAGNTAVADALGYGTSNTFEATPATAATVTTSLNRTNGVDTDVNSADFSTAAPTPQNAASDAQTPTDPTDPTEPTDPTDPTTPADPTDPTTPTDPTNPAAVTIAEIQGTTDTSPLAGQTVTTRGVVTASYPTGGLNGYYIQTPATGGQLDLATHTASDAVFVFSSATVAQATIGSYVEVTGAVSEYKGASDTLTLTELTVPAGGLTVLGDTVTPPTPAAVAVPTDLAKRESLEGMLVAPTGDYTVTDNYDTNYYGSIVLTAGAEPLVTPTSVVEPGSAEYTAMVAANAAAAITLDDGASTNFNSAANKSKPLPYLTVDAPVRIGAAVTFTRPVVMDYRFNAWSLQPTQELTQANAATVQPATFENTRTAAPKAVGGDATVASFNVLNYFSTTGDELTGCKYYTDRTGNPVTVNNGCDARGAAEQEDLDRQQAKIVSAINALDADVVSLEEIENSARFGLPRDASLEELTAALNAAAGAGTWAFVPSPASIPADEDVIRTAFIYKPAVVETVDSSVILDDPAFGNARDPLAQAFQLKGGGTDSRFLTIVNHFKSKGSGEGADADKNDGQGASNASRVNQAKALVAFAAKLTTDTGIDRVLLSGDFNSYEKEDPIDVILAAGFTDLGEATGKKSYAFDGAVGSLDHVFASKAAAADVSGTDIWNINSVESIALEYSRYNYNATNFYTPDAYRSSDHDPVVVGLNLTGAPLVDVNLLNINDFHGRIDANTVKFAGTIESLKKEKGEENSLFLSDGDNIGASLFASSSQGDQPTIDVLNALELAASAVGNHEFDQGYADLASRVSDEADWSYLGANVYNKGTTTPALDEYDIFTVDGVRVAVIGAVTQETPTLVSPDRIATLDFGDPVEAVNRVVGQLKAADAADVFIAEYHEGAGSGTPDGASLEQELALTDTAFAKIVNNTSADVDAIFTGHTHKQYAWDAPVPGEPGVTRPVLQTGSYGENIGQIVLTVDPSDDDVVSYTARNVPRVTTADDVLVASYPRVAEVKSIVDSALQKAAVIGNQPVGSVTADITTAFIGTSRDDRGSESTLGNLVANSLVSSLSNPTLGGAEIGVVNPGGLRGELLKGDDGVITYAEANAVLPFVNNLGTTSLTGAQFKTVLEQQWQTTTNGTAPAKPFLNLGLSNNVNYTFDASRAQGDRITSISVNGQAIDPAKQYRIGTFSFLLTGGDNFREFTNGTNTRDSGLIDRDAWISYLTANSPISPAYDRRGVSVTGVPSETLEPGASGTVQLSKLDLTSLGVPPTTEVSASFEGSTAAPVVSPVSAGASTVAFTVPSDVAANATLVIVAKPTGTTVRVPISVNSVVVPPAGPPTEAPVAAGEESLTPQLEGGIVLSDDTVLPGQTITVTLSEQYAGSYVSAAFYSTPRQLGGWQLVNADGTIQVTIPTDVAAGQHRLSVQDANGSVIGWAALSVLAEQGVTIPGSDPAGGANGSAGGNGTAGLANTGTAAAPLLVGALLLLVAGGAFTVMRRRRNATTASES